MTMNIYCFISTFFDKDIQIFMKYCVFFLYLNSADCVILKMNSKCVAYNFFKGSIFSIKPPGGISL